jgi:hypothetical protein
MNQELLKLRWVRILDQKIAVVHGTLVTILSRNSNQKFGEYSAHKGS